MITVRISFEKCGEAAYISLLDLQRVMHRALKRSGLPVWYTKGFNPHIYLAFACPLPLGQESLCESCEVKTEQETPDPAAWAAALEPMLPRGLRVTGVYPVETKTTEIATAEYELRIPAQYRPALEAYAPLESASVSKKTKSGVKPFELKEYLPEIPFEQQGDTLLCRISLPAGDGLNLSPALLLQFLQDHFGVNAWQCAVLRLRFRTKNGAEFR